MRQDRLGPNDGVPHLVRNVNNGAKTTHPKDDSLINFPVRAYLNSSNNVHLSDLLVHSPTRGNLILPDNLHVDINGATPQGLDSNTCISSQHSADITNGADIKHIKLISWNIRGIGDKLCDPDLRKLLFFENYDIIILFETMKDDTFSIDIPKFQYYNFARKWVHPRARRSSGGIGIFVSDKIKRGVQISSTSDLIVWINLKRNYFKCSADTHIGCIYFPPEGSTYTPDRDCYDFLQDELAKYKGQAVLLCGDFNARTGSAGDFEIESVSNLPGVYHWSEHVNYDSNVHSCSSRVSVDKHVNQYGKRLLQLCKATGFQILNGRIGLTKGYTCFTPAGNSTVDYLLAHPTYQSLIQKFCILPKRVESDHVMLHFNLKLPINTPESSICSHFREEDSVKVNTKPKILPNRYIWDKRNVQNYLRSLTNTKSQELKSDFLSSMSCDIDTICDKFYDFIHYSLDKNFKKKRTSKCNNTFPKNAWFDYECKQLKANVNSFPKYFDISKSENWNEYSKLTSEYKRLIQMKKRQYKESNLNTFQNMLDENPDEYWKFWKKLKHNTGSNASIDLDTFTQYFSSQNEPPLPEYCDIDFMKHISNLVDKFKESNAVYHDNDPFYFILNSPVSEIEVQNQLKRLKPGKACGCDGIAIEFFKCADVHLVPYLTALFNAILSKGVYPTAWAEGIINPIHKSGTNDDPDHYRKITILVAIGKLFEAVLLHRLEFKNEAMNQNDSFQFGFKKNCRTSDNLFLLQSIIEKQKFKQKPLYVCFVDFTKAFDYINRQALFYKLIRRGVNGNFCKVLMDLFQKANYRIRWQGELSEKINSLFGVLQGGMISPKLFTEYLSDLGVYLNESCGIKIDDVFLYYLLYADDLILCSETPEGLQQQLDGLLEFCKKWHVIINLTKTKILIFNQKATAHKFYFNSVEIERSTNYKYLGVWLNTDKFDYFGKTSEYLTNQAQKALFQATTLSNPVVGKLSPALAFKVFDSQIMPILEYGAEIWSPGKQIHLMEKFHLKFIKNVLWVRPQTPTDAVYVETGRLPLEIRHKLKILKYWIRLVSLPASHVLKKAYNTLNLLQGLGQKNWCFNVRKLLFSLDLSEAWESHEVSDESLFIRQATEKLVSKHVDQCLARIQNCDNSKKLRLYKTFKNQYTMEPYLTHIRDTRYRVALSRFRLSSHNLEIELGRHTNPKTPVERRICKNCHSNETEDEIHFLLKCQKFINIRLPLLNCARLSFPDFNSLPIESQFQLLMTTSDSDLLTQLGKYVHSGFEISNVRA